MKQDWYKNNIIIEKKIAKEKAFREREKQYKAIRINERENLLHEIELAINEKTKYLPVNETAVVPMVSVEDLVAIFAEARENSKKIKKYTHF